MSLRPRLLGVAGLVGTSQKAPRAGARSAGKLQRPGFCAPVGAGLPGGCACGREMAEAPGSGRRSRYKAVGSLSWKEAFRQVRAGLGRSQRGRRPSPRRPPCEAGAGRRAAAAPGRDATQRAGRCGSSRACVRGWGEPARSPRAARPRAPHPVGVWGWGDPLSSRGRGRLLRSFGGPAPPRTVPAAARSREPASREPQPKPGPCAEEQLAGPRTLPRVWRVSGTRDGRPRLNPSCRKVPPERSGGRVVTTQPRRTLPRRVPPGGRGEPTPASLG